MVKNTQRLSVNRIKQLMEETKVTKTDESHVIIANANTLHSVIWQPSEGKASCDMYHHN